MMDTDKQDLEKIMDDWDVPIDRATPILCNRKYGNGFVYYDKGTAYCSRDYECLYKQEDNKCMNIAKRYN